MMRRRDFLKAGCAAGLAATAIEPVASQVSLGCIRTTWLISAQPAVDPVASAANMEGHRVLRVPDDAATLWYQHVAPAIELAEPLSVALPAGSAFLLGQLAHLRGRLVPAVLAELLPAGFEAWRIEARPSFRVSTRIS